MSTEFFSLDQICIKHGTDKATTHSVKGHGYAPVYDRHFDHLRQQPIKLIEIGVGGGESIRAWLDYFPAAKVFGVDTVHHTNEWNNPERSPNGRYTFVNGDQSDTTFWRCFEADYGRDWDIVIDDGGHFSGQVVTAYTCLWPLLAPAGLYCIEDLACAYSGIFQTPSMTTHLAFLRALMDDVHEKEGIEWMQFSKELVILKKSG
jgi:hypothetical protein